MKNRRPGAAGDSLVVALRRLANALAPNACVFCGEPRPAAAIALCGPCRADLPPARPWPNARRVLAPYAYEYPLDAAIKALKYRRRLHYAPALGALLAELAPALPADIDAVLPVPLHWRRRFQRGFNQAAELARPLRRRLGVPLVRGVVRRTPTLPQSGLGAAARRGNVRGAFVVRGTVDARHVLIVDDVVTTGATCAQLALTLKRAGVRDVSVVALARAY